MQRTPLYSLHESLGAHFTTFAGWSMPVYYTSILEEHKQVRQAVGLFDVSHMGEILLTGPQACLLLDRVCTNNISALKSGRALYTCLCDESGGTIEDAIVYALEAQSYLMCVNAANHISVYTWMQKYAKKLDCVLESVSDFYGQIAVQGPRSEAVLKEFFGKSMPALTHFEVVTVLWEDVSILMSRTGYTGEDGFELYIPAFKTLAVTEALLKAGKAFGITMIGLGARDSLRLEMGYPLYGHELSKTISPIQAGLGFAVKFDKPTPFIGKEALIKQKENPDTPKVVFFKLNTRRIARADLPIVDASGEEIGRVLSGTFSQTLGQAIGSALLCNQSNPPFGVVLGQETFPLLLCKAPLI